MDLIMDRTQADVLMGTEKGFYGPKDLNRVEQAVAELSAVAKDLDIPGAFVVKTDWALPGEFSQNTWPTVTQMWRYLDNIYRLCNAVALAADLPVSMENLTWEGANQIERSLEQAYIRIQSVLQTFQFSGEIFAGEENDL